MTIPTSEIPQERQDAARAIIDAGTWGRLPSAVQDRLIRKLDSAAGASSVTGAYGWLVNPSAYRSESQFAQLREAEQMSILDCFRRMPTIRHAVWMEWAIASLLASGIDGSPRTRAIDVMCRPSDADSESDPDDRAMLRAYYLGAQEERLRGLSGVLEKDGFRAASDTDKSRVLDIVEIARGPGLSDLATLLDQHRHPPAWTRLREGAADMFSDDLRDSPQKMLDHLHRLAQGPLDSRVTIRPVVRNTPSGEFTRFGSTAVVRANQVIFHDRDIRGDLAGVGDIESRAMALGELIAELAFPSRHLNQDNRGTCAVTTFIRRLALYCPAEYARLAVDLLLAGQSTLRDGSTLQPPDDGFAADDSNRSPSERLTQSAVMRHWRSGYRMRDPVQNHNLYRNTLRTRADSTNPTGNQEDGFRGSYDQNRDNHDVELLLSAMLGGQFTTVTQHRIARTRAELTAEPDRGVFAALDWGTGGHVIEVVLVADIPATTGTGTVTRVAFWNPWGAPTIAYVNGSAVRFANSSVGWTGDTSARRGEPTTRTESGDAGIQSMSMQDFRRFLQAIWVPGSGH